MNWTKLSGIAKATMAAALTAAVGVAALAGALLVIGSHAAGP
jgi:hypothetical protein